MSVEPVILGSTAGQVISLRGTQVRVLATANVSTRASSFDFRPAPGFDTGAHTHSRIEEQFFVIEGELELRAGDQVVIGGPGTFVSVPAGVPHSFANRADVPARMLLFASPAGHEGYFEELAEILAQDGPPDPQAIAALRRKYDTVQVETLTT